MSFCTSLRRRSSCAELLRSINSTSTSGPCLRETDLRTHDVCMPIPTPQGQATRTLRVLILTPSAIGPDNLASTLSRIVHFDSITSSKDNVIFYLPSPSNGPDARHDMETFQNLQALLLSSFVYINLVLLPCPEAFKDCLTAFTAIGAVDSSSKEPSIPDPSFDVLPYCSLDAPLDDGLITVLKESTLGLGDLATAQRNDSIFDTLMINGMDEQNAQSCVEFWRDEYLTDS